VCEVHTALKHRKSLVVNRNKSTPYEENNTVQTGDRNVRGFLRHRLHDIHEAGCDRRTGGGRDRLPARQLLLLQGTTGGSQVPPYVLRQRKVTWCPVLEVRAVCGFADQETGVNGSGEQKPD
jgi:hypothetical protein